MSEPEGVSLVVPFAEVNRAAAPQVAWRWLEALRVTRRPAEAFVVGPGAADASPGPDVGHIESPGRLGDAIRAGVAVTTQPLILIVGCDHPFAVRDLPKLLEAIAQRDEELNVGVDLVTGSRASAPVGFLGRALHGTYRRFMRLALNLPVEPLHGKLGWKLRMRRLASRALFAVRVQDPQSSLKLVRRTLLDRFVTQSSGPMILTELLAKANFLGAVMSEVPVGSPEAGVFAPYPDDPGWGREFRRLAAGPKFKPPAPESNTASVGA